MAVHNGGRKWLGTIPAVILGLAAQAAPGVAQEAPFSMDPWESGPMRECSGCH